MVFKITGTSWPGPHIRVRVFAAPSPNKTFSLLGELACNQEEWVALNRLVDHSPYEVPPQTMISLDNKPVELPTNPFERKFS